MKNKRKTAGFTLAELLIVVAIIGVLVAVSIPVFANQLEKSREATDLANVRSAYAEVMAAAITGDESDANSGIVYNAGEYSKTVDLKQKTDGWQSSKSVRIIGGIKEGDAGWKWNPRAGGQCKVSYSENAGVIINWSFGMYNYSNLTLGDKTTGISTVINNLGGNYIIKTVDEDDKTVKVSMYDWFVNKNNASKYGGFPIINPGTEEYTVFKNELATAYGMDVNSFDCAIKNDRQNGYITLFLSESISEKKQNSTVEARKIVFRVDGAGNYTKTESDVKGTIQLSDKAMYGFTGFDDSVMKKFSKAESN